MSEHLNIKIKDKYLVLPEDFQIDIDDVNPIFNDYSGYSYDFQIPIDLNRHIFGNLSDLRSQRKPVDLEFNKIQVFCEGIQFRSGVISSNDDETLDGSVTLQMVSNVNTLEDLVADLQCNDIPVKDKIQIGEKIGNLSGKYNYKVQLHYRASTAGAKNKDTESLDHYSAPRSGSLINVLEPQALGFSYPAICKINDGGTFEQAALDGSGMVGEDTSFINVSEEYPIKKYCNARVCYTHYDINPDDGSSSSDVSKGGETDPYYVLEANRMQSGICFYILYFLDCLFHYLGLYYDNSNLLKVGDMKRLCFFTTKCCYDVERKYPNKGIVGVDQDVIYDLNTSTEINSWLVSRKTKASVQSHYEPVKDLQSAIRNGIVYEVGDEVPGVGKMEFIRYEVKDFQLQSLQANIMNMYANSENFPQMSVKSLLDSFWASFGVKFIMDHEKNSVKPIFIRDIFRDNSKPIHLNAILLSSDRINEKITGYKMLYSEESDKKEQVDNIKYGIKDYDTNYDYIDYSKVDTEKSYYDIMRRRSNSDTTCYIDRNTGNAYRFKVDSDAKKLSELNVSLFEVGGYKGVEIGDCSLKNEDFIIESISDFQPVIFNDVYGKNAVNVGSNSQITETFPDGTTVTVSNINLKQKESKLAVYVDEDMWHENTKMIIDHSMGDDFIDAAIRLELTTDESYDPTNTEDGNSPLQHYDWGNSIAIMRGGGSDSKVQYYDYNYDGNGNSKWRIVAGEYALSSDSMDNWGVDYDYNGNLDGIGEEERFSLKIRAFKVINGEIICLDDEKDEKGDIIRKIKSRGLYDTFMAEYAHFLLNRKKINIKFLCDLSQMMDINWAKKYQIGDLVFFWNKISYSISKKKGLGEISAEVFVL